MSLKRKIKNIPSWVYYCLVLVLIIPAIIPFLKSSFYTFHDETQIANLHQFISAIKLGQFPPRWAPNMQFNYGSPFLQFYYQLPFYLAFITNVIFGFSLVVSFKFIMVFSLLLGAFGIYFLALKFTKPFQAVLASAIYSLAPYRAVVILVRGTLGEALAFGIFPWVILFLLNLQNKQTKKNLLGATLFIALLALTHQLAILLVLPFILIITLGSSLILKKTKAFFYQLSSLVLGFGLSCFYLLPAIFEKRFLQTSSPFNFYDHFPFIKQLIYSPWGYGSSNWGMYDDMSFRLGIVQWLVVLAGIFIFVKIIVKKQSKTSSRDLTKKTILGLTLFSFLASLFLMNIRSSFFWNIFPYTQLVQFPWRLLMSAVLFSSFIFILLPFPEKLPNRLILSTLILGFLLVPSFKYFQPGKVVDHQDNYFLHRYLPDQVLDEGETVSADYLNHSEDYVPLPLTATRPKILPTKKLTTFSNEAVVSLIDENPFHYSANISSIVSTEFTFHTFDFPGWTIYLNGEKISHQRNKIGAITFPVPEGENQLLIAYQNTPLRAFANYLSVFFLGLIATILLKKKPL